MRKDWAAQYAKIIKPGGFLIAYMYPINTHTDGPPFAVSPEIYRELLSPYFEEVYIKECTVTYERRKTSEHKELFSKWKRKASSV
jgi:hypothetical protein